MKKITLVLLSGVLLFSCSKEPNVSLHQTDKAPIGQVSSKTILGQAELDRHTKNLSVSPYVMSNTVYNINSLTSEVIRTYQSGSSTMHASLADFGFLSQASKDNFLSGMSFAITSTSSATSFILASDATRGYAINQYTGGGAVSMVQASSSSSLGLFTDEVTFVNGAYIRASTVDPNVPGWEVFDPSTGTGYIILLVNNRFGIVVDGTQLQSVQPLIQAARSFDFNGLTALGQ